MADALSVPLLSLEHDHTLMDVMLEDLNAVARQGFAAAEQLLIEDAHLIWRQLITELARHFRFEEEQFFSPGSTRFPDLGERVDGLISQHYDLQSQFSRLGTPLEGSIEELSGRSSRFDACWTAFETAWRAHSRQEWALIQDIRKRMQEAV